MSEPLSLVGEGIRRSFTKSGFALDVERVEAPAGKGSVLRRR